MKLTFISDTHGYEPKLVGGDILFHTGDLTQNGYKSEVIKQLNYLHEQLDKYKYVVLIPGNHDFWAERHPKEFKEACLSAGLMPLIQEETIINGLKIWGSPATPWFHDWAFNYRIDDIKKIWEQIPLDTDILITHGPPFGILDKTMFGTNVGCMVLLDKVLDLKPKIHGFGHIHEAAGAGSNDNTLFVNSAMEVINLELEQGKVKVLP